MRAYDFNRGMLTANIAVTKSENKRITSAGPTIDALAITKTKAH